jgi:hypothetical protein
MKTLVLYATAAGVLLMAHGPVGGQEVCPEHEKLAREALPDLVADSAAYGRWLDVEIVRPQFGEAFNVQVAARVFDDRFPLPRDRDEPGRHEALERIVVDGVEGSRLRIDRERGKISYANPGRRFDGLRDAPAEINPERGLEITTAILADLGVPAVELQREYIEVRPLIAADRPVEGGQTTRVLAEIHVRVPRQVGELPVFDSFATAAVSGTGSVARLSLQWPDFRLAQGLGEARLRTREDILDDIVGQLAETFPCGVLEEIVAHVAWVAVEELRMTSRSGDDDRDFGRQEATAYAPALVVYAQAADPPEDSGQTSFGGLQFVVPLASIEPDARERG